MGWARCLTQNLTYVLPGIREEVVASLSDSLTNSKTPSDAGASHTIDPYFCTNGVPSRMESRQSCRFP